MEETVDLLIFLLHKIKLLLSDIATSLTQSMDQSAIVVGELHIGDVDILVKFLELGTLARQHGVTLCFSVLNLLPERVLNRLDHVSLQANGW